MRFSFRKLLLYYLVVSYLMSGVVFALMAVGFAILAPLLIIEIGGHPVKVVFSIVAAFCIAAVILWVARLTVRVAWTEFAELRKEPPSWGAPPPLPNSATCEKSPKP